MFTEKWIRDFQNLSENIQDRLTHLSENLNRKKTIKQLTQEFIEILNTDKKVRKLDDNEFKYNKVIAILSNRYTPKTVDLEEILHKEPLEKDELKILERIAKNNFRSQNLMFMLKREFDKDHVGDSKGKLSAFLVCCSGKLPPKYRVSMALRGDSSTGKTNLMNTVLKHLPKHWYAWGTRFTRATLEDDVEPFYIIAFSEKMSDDASVIESLKQLTEDGLQTWKHDKESNKLRDVKFIDRKSSLYSSTEKETDEELATRYIVYTVTRDPVKIGKVIESIKVSYSDIKKMIESENREKKETWLTVGLRQLEDFDEIIIPYSKFIHFMNQSPRCQRDAKRFLNLIAVSAWLNQHNRYKYEKDGKKILIASADDFFWVAFLTDNIFKQSMTDIDADIQKLIDTYSKMSVDPIDKTITPKKTNQEKSLNNKDRFSRWILTNELIQKLGITKDSIVKRYKVLENKGKLIWRGKKYGSVSIDVSNDDVQLLTFSYEKFYFIIKQIEEYLLDLLIDKIKLKGSFVKKPIIYRDVNNKIKSTYKSKINVSLHKGKNKIVLTSERGKAISDEFYEIVEEMNKIITSKVKKTKDFSIDEFYDDDEIFII